MTSLRGGSFNCHASRKPAVIKASVRGVCERHELDFLLLQESQHAVAQLATIPGYRLLAHDRCGTAILVRDGVEARWPATVRLGELPWRYRGTTKPRRAVPTAVLGGWLRVASVHGVAQPERPWNAIQYGIGARRLVAWFNSHDRFPLLIAGDWNKSSRDIRTHSPQWVATRIGGTVWTTGHLDYPITRSCGLSGLRAIPEGGSDHQLVLFTVHKEKP